MSALLTGYHSHGQGDTAPINFADHISPIIRENCIVCHNPGGIGPFDFSSYEQVRRRARQIAEVTQSKFMPPWKPHPEYGPAMIGERSLTDEQIQIFQSWYRTGMEAGDLTKTPPLPAQESDWTLGEPDLVVQLPESYVLPAEGVDVYRNFAIPIPLEETRYIQAFELLPQSRLAIHHALLMLDDTGRSRQREKEETGVGFDGMGIGSSAPPSGHIVGWTPGQVPYQAYPGTAWELSPGTDLVLQLHLLPSGKPESINPRIGLYFSEEPPDKPSFVLQMRSYEVEIPAGEANYMVEEMIQLPVAAQILSVYPHAHYLGKDIQLYSILPNGEKQWLLRIPDWDFNWQGDYRYEKPLHLPAGSKIHMSYRFDNSADNTRNPTHPPVDVRGGWRSFDEMAEAMIQVMPESIEDLSKIKEAQKKYDFKLAGGEARFHYFSGIYMEQQNELDRAAKSYLKTIELDPTFASAYFKLGSIYETQGDSQQSEALYKEALAYQPSLVPARLRLAILLFQRNQIRQAGFMFQDLYAEVPENLDVTIYLSRYFLTSKRLDKALALLETGEETFSGIARFHLEYGNLLLSTENTEQAEEQFEKVTQSQTTNVEAGAAQALEKLQAAAYYYLATILKNRGDTTNAREAVSNALNKSPDYLDALLLSAWLFLSMGEDMKAKQNLIHLVARPEQETFGFQDIIDNLPQPLGTLLLADAYHESGSKDMAINALNYAISIHQKEDNTETVKLLEAKKIILQDMVSEE